MASVRFVARLAEDEAVAFGDGVGGKDNGGLRIADCGSRIMEQLLSDGSGFAVGEFGNEAGRAEFAADAAFDVLGRGHNFVLVARFLQQLAAARGSAGEDEVRGLGAGD
jgi:hypothetical protein